MKWAPLAVAIGLVLTFVTGTLAVLAFATHTQPVPLVLHVLMWTAVGSTCAFATAFVITKPPKR